MKAPTRRLAWRIRALLAVFLISLASPSWAFHFPWDQGHDPSVPLQPPPPGPDDRPECDPDCNGGATRSPVFAASGQAYWSDADVVLRGRPYLGVVRSYNSNDPVVGLFGNGWTVDFDIALYPANSGGQVQRVLRAANGKRFVFVRQADGSFKAPASRFETIVEGPSSVTMTSLDGRRQVFALDGRMLERFDINNNRIAFSYDASARPTRIEDGNGRSLAITYNGLGFVDSVTDHGARTWRYSYDASGNLLSVQDPANGRRSYRYQAYKPAGDAQTYQQLLSVADPTGVFAVQYTYTGNQVASYTEGANKFTYVRSSGNTKLGGTVTRTDSLGARSTFVYGAQGLVTQDTDALSAATTYVYDSNGRVNQITDALGRVWVTRHDTLGRITEFQNPLSQKYTATYIANDPRPRSVVSPSGRTLRLNYDSKGNLTTTTDPSGALTQVGYNTKGDPNSIRNVLGQQTSINYNSIGLPTKIVDALGRQTNLTYDSLGRPTAATNSAGESLTLSYDALDRVTAMLNSLVQTTSFEYDSAGRVLAITDPKGSRTKYEYDAFGRRSAEVAPDGRRTQYTYRLDNLLDRLTWPDGTFVSYLYDGNKRVTRETAGSEVINYTYNAVNQLLSASGPGGLVAYTYDAAGRVETETSDGKTHVAVRNSDGEVTGLNALSESRTYTRDDRGLVTRIASPAGNFDFSYDALGRRVTLGYPNGSTVAYGFDSGGRLNSLAHVGAFNASYAYSHDSVGRITGIVGDGADWSYSYDALGRLSNAAQATQVYAYNYDEVGNITDGGRAYDINHRLTGDAAKTYTYDARGNLTLEQDRVSGARLVYTWNVKNQLRQLDYFPAATGTTPTRRLLFAYDPLGRRTSKSDGGILQRYTYDGRDLIGVSDSAGTVLASHIFGGNVDEPLGISTGGSTKFIHANHLGSVVALSEGASLVESHRYDPYGNLIQTSGGGATSFAYTGREKDTENLYFYRTRYYQTGLGRFISVDPVGMHGGMNPYAYVEGNPLSYVDPDGEFAWIAAGAVIGSVVNVGVTYFANGGNVTGRQLAAAAVSGAIAGAVGAAAGPLGGTLARGILGAASNSAGAAVAAGAISGAGSAAGQAAANLIDPCNATNPLNAALWGAVGGGVAKGLFPTRNLNSWRQASYFGPSTLRGLFGSSNAWTNNASFAASSGIGGAANFPALNPF